MVQTLPETLAATQPDEGEARVSTLDLLNNLDSDFDQALAEGEIQNGPTVPAQDAEASARAQYKVRFSSQLMLPVRLKLGVAKAQYEPGLLKDFKGFHDSEYASAHWPDGFSSELPETVGFIKAGLVLS